MTDQDGIVPGTLIAGRFEVIDVLGQGGMGTVYRATQLSLDRPIALKVVHPKLALDKAVRMRFLREARVSASLRHPNAVEIYDFGEDGDRLYLAMELLDGLPLRSVVDVDLPPHDYRDASRIGRQIAEVLVAAAEIDLVHRDLKPENIMVDRKGGAFRIVVVDFGLAFRSKHTAETGRITDEGMAAGTPDYMSPEQIRGQPATPATDIYALGCILYEMLTSHAPLVAGAPTITLSRHLFTSPEPMRTAYPSIEVPAELDDLVLGMMAKSPAERPSAASVRDVLLRFEQGMRARSTTESEPMSLTATGRAGRMLSERPTPVTDAPAMDPDPEARSKSIAIVGGAVDVDVRLALEVNGYRVAADVTSEVSAIVILGSDESLVRHHAPRRIPMVVEVDPTLADGVFRMLRAGATDVFGAPLDGSMLARRLTRAIRKSAR